MTVAILRIRPSRDREDISSEVVFTRTAANREEALELIKSEFANISAEHFYGHMEIHEYKP